MQIQKIFKAGNSEVVSIPKHILKELDMKTGEKVVVFKDEGNERLIVQKARKEKTKKKDATSKEFKKWLKVFMKENGEILDELAKR